MAAALVFARLALYLAASALFGGARLLARWPAPVGGSPGERRLLLGAAGLLIAATIGDLLLQVASMTGGDGPAFDAAAVHDVLFGTPFGYATLARLAAGTAAAVALLSTGPERGLRLCSLLGGVAALSLTWGGHGAAGEGATALARLGADLLHLLAAALWIGALFALGLMALDPRVRSEPPAARRLHLALEGFSGAGTLAVAVLILTGLVNAGFLVGPTHLPALVTTAYGRLLLAKLALFALMLALAAANRWRLAPRLGAAAAPPAVLRAVAALRRSLLLETTAAVMVLAAVAWLGTLEPPASI